MLRFYFIIFITLSSTLAQSQDTIAPQEKDSIFVVNSFEYDLNYGISMYHKFCYNQKTFNKSERLESEINYAKKDERKSKITSVIYYYYNSRGQLSSKETVSVAGDLQHAINYFYNSEGGGNMEIEFEMVGGTPKLIGFQKFSYSTPENYKITYFNSHKKKYATGEIVAQNDLYHELTIYKKPELNDGLVSKQYIKILSDNVTVKDSTTFTYEDGKTTYKTTHYAYKNDGRLIKSSSIQNDSLVPTLHFRYFPDGKKQSVQEKDANGKIMSYTGFEPHVYYRVYTKPDAQSINYLQELKVKIPKE